MLLWIYAHPRSGGRWFIDRLESRCLLAADLLGTSFDVTPDALDKDPTITVSFTVKNQNGIPFLDDAGAFDVDFYLSSNSTISSSDTFIGSSHFTGLGAGQSASRSVQFTSSVPAVDPFHDDNEYFFGMIIDRIDVVSESDETNNRNRGQGLDRDNVKSEFNLPSPVDGTNFSATSMSIGTDVLGSFEDEWIGTRDQDIFSFTVPAGNTISFDYDATSAASSQDAYLRIFNSSWNLVAANDNAAAPGEPAGDDPYLTHTFTTAGTYYAVIGGAADSNSNPRLMSDRTDLHAGTYALRTAVIPNAPDLDLNSTSDTGDSSTDNITRDTTPTFTISGEAEGTAKLYVDGALAGSDSTSAKDGTYAITTSALPPGTRHVTATITNAAGFEGLVSPQLNVTIDNIAPNADFTLASDTGRSSTDGITKDNTPNFSGFTNEDATVTYFKGGTQLGSTTTTNSWGFAITTALADGAYQFTATAEDVAGNIENSTPVNVTIDTIAPPQPAAPDLSDAADSGRSNTDNITNVNTPIFVGTVEPFGRVRRSLDGAAPGTTGGTDTSASGGYSIAITSPPDGTHTFAIVVEDRAGNVSVLSPALQFVYDTVAPGTAYEPDLDPSSDLGPSNTDDITTDNTPLVIGRHDLHDITVEILVDGVVKASGIADAGPVNIQLPQLTDGTHQLQARASDAAGNTTGVLTTILSITIDTVAPSIVGTPVFNFQSAQNLVYSFSENVQPALAVSDIVVQNTTTNTNVADAAKQISYVTLTNTAVLGFTQILTNGLYQSTIAAANVTDVAGNSLSAGSTFGFFFVNADANRDGAANALDFNILATNFGRSPRNFGQGNFNYDSVVNTLDFSLLAQNFNARLAINTPPIMSASLPTKSHSVDRLFSTALVDDRDDSVLP